MDKKYGNFAAEGTGFHIHTPDIPRNWYNYLWNDQYVTFVSQTGAGDGITQDAMGRRIHLVKDRCLFMLENGESWGITGLPVAQKLDAYRCTHRLGSTVIHTEKQGIATDVTFFVPNDDACEIWLVKIKNLSNTPRTVKVMGYTDTKADGGYTRQGYNTSIAEYDPELTGISLTGFSKFGNGERRAFHAFLALDQAADEYCCTANGFVGPYGSFAHPLAVEKGCLPNDRCVIEHAGFSLAKELRLASDEEATVTYICGVGFSRDEILTLRNRYAGSGAEKALASVTEKFATQIKDVTIRTPDEKLNRMLPWLMHQANMGSRWARVRHNGYRDITSDTECLAAVNPMLALERFKRVLTYQYSNGYAPRTFLDGVIKDNNFADNTVWMTFTASTLVKELGDVTVLDTPVAFNDGSEAPIYVHLKRSVDFLYNFRGLHGLIKIWGGDWNDCMNTAGLQGKGVSVWLSLAWLRANKMFAELARLTGQHEDAALADARTEEMQRIIETEGWDGSYYLCAYTDWDEKIGSHECQEGKIFLIPQIWSVFSGVSGCGREKLAMDAVEALLASDAGIVISRPGYTKYDPHIGVVTTKPAGCHENGGVYLHTIAWKIAADAMLKRADKVEAGINTFLPFRNPAVAGRAEPYMSCNSYCGPETGDHVGLPGQSWRSASGPWFVKSMINYVFGLQPEVDGLRIDPCLPPSWKTCSITKKFRDCCYNIHYDNRGTHIESITVDGAPITGSLLPYIPGKTVQVQVVLR